MRQAGRPGTPERVPRRQFFNGRGSRAVHREYAGLSNRGWTKVGEPRRDP